MLLRASALMLGSIFAFCLFAQSNEGAQDQKQGQTQTDGRSHPGAVHEMGAGVGTAAAGTAKGAGEAAKGVGKGAGDLVTLHPIDAAGSVGKGAVTGGKDVTVGAAKGTGKVARGVGRVFKKIF